MILLQFESCIVVLDGGCENLLLEVSDIQFLCRHFLVELAFRK